MIKTLFIVCIQDKGRNDFLYVCKTLMKATIKAARYRKDYPGTETIIFEETLHQ